jgi:hypothetical protein
VESYEYLPSLIQKPVANINFSTGIPNHGHLNIHLVEKNDAQEDGKGPSEDDNHIRAKFLAGLQPRWK